MFRPTTAPAVRTTRPATRAPTAFCAGLSRLVEIRYDGTGLTRGLERVDRPLCVAFVCVAGPVAEANFAGVLVDELLHDDAVGRIDYDSARRHLAEVGGDPETRLRCVSGTARKRCRRRPSARVWPRRNPIGNIKLRRPALRTLALANLAVKRCFGGFGAAARLVGHFVMPCSAMNSRICSASSAASITVRFPSLGSEPAPEPRSHYFICEN